MARLPTDTQDFTQYELPPPVPDVLPIVASPNGAVLATGEFASPNYVKGVSGWKLDAQGNFEAVNGTFSGTLGAVSLNIPDTTTANSFHVDANGNAWWGANVATGYTGANAYILSTGAAVFKNVQIGGLTVQYVITNSGIFNYGDGGDGVATCDGSTAVAGMSLAASTYTMTRDVYFDTLSINDAITLNEAGYRIFVKNTLTDGQGSSGTIARNGNNGGNGGDGANNAAGVAGAGATALAVGYLNGAAAGGGGGAGGNNSIGSDGNASAAVANSLGLQGSTGGHGGDAAGNTGGNGASGGGVTPANVALKVGVQLAELLDVHLTNGTKPKYTNSSSGGGGGGGGSIVNNQGGGGGGGGGGAGGIVAIYARNIVINAGAKITVTGGNGGNGGNGGTFTTPNGGVGGGAAGGNGGIIILTYNSLTNNGSITATAGTKGTKGTIGQTGSATDGNNGSAGVIYQFQLSL